jgi:hypothetical protein
MGMGSRRKRVLHRCCLTFWRSFKWRPKTRCRRSILFVLPSAALLSACSTVPRDYDVTRKSTYQIVQQIRCDARRAVLDSDSYGGAYYQTATVAYEFEFNIQEDDNAAADATWTLPYTLGGSLSLVANAGLNRTRFTKRNFKIADTFDQLRQTKDCEPHDPRQDIIYPISGDIGVYETVRTFIRLQQVDNKKSGEVFTFGDTLTFTTTFLGGVKPSIVISPLADRFRLASANGDFNARRNDIHTVTLALAGTPPKDSKSIGSDLSMASASRSRVVPLGVPLQTNSSLLSSTLIQATVNPTDRALIELDRQRIIALQDRAKTLLVGP